MGSPLPSMLHRIKSGRWGRVLLFFIFLIVMAKQAESSQVTTHFMLSGLLVKKTNCLDQSITKRNLTSKIILSATATSCGTRRAGSYSCSLQVWRVMKGKDKVRTFITESLERALGRRKALAVYGLGKSRFCLSDVEDGDTRIFFLDLARGRLVLSAPLLRITLSNLQNTQAVIEGRRIQESPSVLEDPCLDVLCGFGGHCETRMNSPVCVCPDRMCDRLEQDTLAPVCGSNQITYANHCHLKSAQCLSQRRIRIMSGSACEPLLDDDVCGNVTCTNSAVCHRQYLNGRVQATCICPSCDDAVSPVCASDHRSYSSECVMKRKACIHGKKLSVIRRTPCDPCEVYNVSAEMFVRACTGQCSYDGSGVRTCCDHITCPDHSLRMVCGSDGNTYQSICALNRFSCLMARNIAVIEEGRCPDKKIVTKVRGSIPIARGQCPGNCKSTNKSYKKFVRRLSHSVNKRLHFNNSAGNTLGDFRILHARSDIPTLVYELYASTVTRAITTEDTPTSLYRWVYDRLYDEETGIFTFLLNEERQGRMDEERDPIHDFLVEDVCLYRQCEHGQVCSLHQVGGTYTPTCSCEGMGDGSRVAATGECKQSSDGRRHDNQLSRRNAMCLSSSFITQEGNCSESQSFICGDDVDGCDWPGEVCVITNGHGECQCLSCDEVFEPVCASSGETFKNFCYLLRHNCLARTRLIVKKMGICERECDDVMCLYNSQCEEMHEGTVCNCAHHCMEINEPVCGSDCVTYRSHCHLVAEACRRIDDVVALHDGECGSGCMDVSVEQPPVEDCGCRFGGSCNLDGIDEPCVCSFNCSTKPSAFVCGSDGRTYTNLCRVEEARCERQEMIYVVGDGECGESCKSSLHGCCADGITPARGIGSSGCPEVCKCNIHGSYSNTCDPVSGQCACRPGVGGRRCDHCMIGFWNFDDVIQHNNIGCVACNCFGPGSTRDDCNQLTGGCTCKPGVGGMKCSSCLTDDSMDTDSRCGISTKRARSCEDIDCKQGQICERDEEGWYLCTCPSLSSCSDHVDTVVCGGDGVNYANACHMGVIACRGGRVIRVVRQGRCSDAEDQANPTVGPTNATDFPNTSVPSQTTVPLFTPHDSLHGSTFTSSDPHGMVDEVETHVATTHQPFSQPLPSLSETTQSDSFMRDRNQTSPSRDSANRYESTIHPYTSESTPSMDETGSGIDGCELDDDEDCIRGSTTPIHPSNTTPSTSGDLDLVNPTTAIDSRVSLHHIEGSFIEADGVDLKYSNQLTSPQSQLFASYSTAIEAQMMSYINNPSLFQTITAIRITSFWRSRQLMVRDGGVNVGMDMYVIDGVDVDEVLDRLNDISQHHHHFHKHTSTEDEMESEFIFNITSPYSESGKWRTPQFGGSSYFVFPLLERVTSSITIRMDFRSFDGEGLLIFASHQRSSDDFVSLSVKGGHVEFRFNTGSGTLKLRSKIDITDQSGGGWHSVVAHRNRRDGMLRVDDELAIQGTSPKGTSGLNVKPKLFLGGFNSKIEESVKRKVQVSKGLTGCIKKISIINRVLTINSSSRNISHRVGNCVPSPCLPNPCTNAANCFIKLHQGSYTHKCQCTEGYKGKRCEQTSSDGLGKDPCTDHQCHPSSRCVVDSMNSTSYSCVCAGGRSGRYCEDGMSGPSFMPAFAGDSYILRDSMGKKVKTEMNVDLTFYSSQADGLIFYNGEKKSTGDFVALNLQDRHLEFMYNLGNGVARIRSLQPIRLDAWHNVRLSRKMRLGEMVVDGGSPQKGQSPKVTRKTRRRSDFLLNLDEPLYLGGFPHYGRLPVELSVDQGLVGSLQKFSVNRLNLSLNLNKTDHYNVQPFNAHPCFHKPCRNGGTCYPNLGHYNCACPKDWGGDLCRHNMSLDANYQREQAFSGVYFDGNTKAQYRYAASKTNPTTHNAFILHITTHTQHGLLLLMGKATSTGRSIGDYLALAVSNGRLHLQYNLGSGPADVISKERVDDGSLSVIRVERNGRKASIQINNGLLDQVEAAGSSVELNTDGYLWIGGIDYQPRGIGLYKSFFRPFIGCLSALLIHNQPIRLQEDSLNSPSLLSCT